eukprot:4574626-Amphidinium_carterae.1
MAQQTVKNTSSGEEVDRRESVPEGVDHGPQTVTELRGEGQERTGTALPGVRERPEPRGSAGWP